MTDKELQRSKIRERYKGADIDKAEIIPARRQVDLFDDVERRVAVYVRVSTNNIQQTSSYELQKNYYEDMILRHPNWKLTEIYADEGISGTSLRHRDQFNRMISDCEAGKVDLIITKSVSRFARNIIDCITTVKKLKNLPASVGVYFETDGIFSLRGEDEQRLNLMSTIAQEESHIKSSIMNASIDMRFSHGILLTPVLLGYDHDENGKLVINESEARTVRLIFFMYLYGYTCEQIAEELEKLGRQTKKGNTGWSAGSVLNVLRNERHCGDVLAHKTFTPDYCEHKSKKNRGDRTQYRWKDDHEAIIARSDFLAVQQLIDNVKYKNTDILPKLKVVTAGALNGFVLINPRWSGFKSEDYINISENVLSKRENSIAQIEAKKGNFDFRGYEIARSQLFNTADKISVTFTATRFKFSTGALRRMENCRNIEMLIYPCMKLFAVRKCNAEQKNSVSWNSFDNRGKCVPRYVGGKAFLCTLFELADWNTEYKYCARGVKLCKGSECVLIFDLNDPEVFIPRRMLDNETADNIPASALRGPYISAMHKKQAANFGENFYKYLHSVEVLEKSEALIINERPITFSELENIDVTPEKKLGENINKLIEDITEGHDNVG